MSEPNWRKHMQTHPQRKKRLKSSWQFEFHTLDLKKGTQQSIWYDMVQSKKLSTYPDVKIIRMYIPNYDMVQYITMPHEIFCVWTIPNWFRVAVDPSTWPKIWGPWRPKRVNQNPRRARAPAGWLVFKETTYARSTYIGIYIYMLMGLSYYIYGDISI